MALREVFSWIVAISIFIIMNYNTISTVTTDIFAEKPIPITIAELGKVSLDSGSAIFDSFKPNRLYVPDYLAKIYIDFENKPVTVDENLRFRVKVDDLGIEKLQKPYFYILVADPKDKVVGFFPNFCDNNVEQYSDFGTYQHNSGKITFILDNQKPIPWRSENFKENRINVHCYDSENFFCINQKCENRSVYIKGTMNNGSPLFYSYKTDQSGTWKVYVLLFDTEYKSRHWNQLQKFGENAVEVQMAEKYVSSTSPPEQPRQKNYTLEILYIIVSLATSILGYFTSARYVYNILENFYRTNRRLVRETLITVLISLIVLLFFVRFVLKII
ncbi:MAG: hypothetical protein V1859_10565 [archaeon]